MGIFRPKIYLPQGLSEQEQEYIILHEKCHIRRCDHIVKLVAFIAWSTHWFNRINTREIVPYSSKRHSPAIHIYWLISTNSFCWETSGVSSISFSEKSLIPNYSPALNEFFLEQNTAAPKETLMLSEPSDIIADQLIPKILRKTDCSIPHHLLIESIILLISSISMSVSFFPVPNG